ncbi:MAG: peptide-methionine (S)-S-oxide reductase [Bacteroidota bacterium]
MKLHPSEQHKPANLPPTDSTTFGGGCFWSLDEPFRCLRGVHEVVCGYAGALKDESGSDAIGRAEVVQVRFDPGVILYRDLLEVFFALHNPLASYRTTTTRWSSYRSIILYRNVAQKEVAEAILAKLEGETQSVSTELAPLSDFVPAEDRHQGYYRCDPSRPYCRAVIEPKLTRLRTLFQEKLK